MEFDLNNAPPIDARLTALREQAKNRRDPATEDDTLRLLLSVARMLKAERILEIGTAEGLTSIALLLECPKAEVTTIELEEERYILAKKNFARFGVEDRTNLILGDAGEVLLSLQKQYDLIFLDGPKAQYLQYFPQLKRLLRTGGALFADDVLLYGWVSGKVETPVKRRSIVRKIREYLQAVSADRDFLTNILEVGEGVALSIKK